MSVHPGRPRGRLAPPVQTESGETQPASDRRPRSLRHSRSAHILHSRYDSRALTAAARAAFDQRFRDHVDPDGVLPEKERERRAKHLRTAYFQGLALKSAQARRARTRRRKGAEQ